ncbi:MAG TPA: bifunctional 23S rRNA (guanine(2069)-N(7))-methyltransferase RlmK/23S rRNA (guanine(2445)-N(2))-methyltransferase RlmL, partial [Gammaproteobacteria bacterium]
VAGAVQFARGALVDLAAPDGAQPGLVVANPPYGARLGAVEGLPRLYADLGQALRRGFPGWRAAVLSGDPGLAQRLGAERPQRHALFNGALPCTLFCWQVPEAASDGSPWARAAARVSAAADGAPMFADRLRKNLRRLERWARREGIGCYRLYDADLPEYALAVDLYATADGVCAHVQEYAPPRNVDPARAAARRAAALGEIPAVLGIGPDAVSYRLRERQRGLAQYQKLEAPSAFHEVREGACRLLVNFDAYLDTGLFLDHRPTRLLLGRLAAGRRFLNLFAYTGTATVHAAVGGAAATTSVDLSATYLEWAGRNLALNGCAGPQHELVRADCLDWLAQARRDGRRYGLVFVDPPTFSNSKRTEQDFEVQRDHVRLLGDAAALLEDDGVLLFSTNFRRFRLDQAALGGLAIEEISRQTVPEDFRRSPRIHRCWRITRGG